MKLIVDNPSYVWIICIIFMLEPILMQQPIVRTQLDANFEDFARAFHIRLFEIAGNNLQNIQRYRNIGKTQNLTDTNPPKLAQFCDAKNGPGARSKERPISVHRLRPGDIDIIGAMGDSITTGFGAFASDLLHLLVENRGVSWSIGGQGNWTEFLTLPNIFKEFNPNLYGYSLKDSYSTQRQSRFNVAEVFSMSRDMPHQARNLVKRLKSDPHVNMTEDWKLVTLLIGNNDICADICYYEHPEEAIKWHEQNMLKTFRYLRDNVPRLILNVVPSANVFFITEHKTLPPQCEIILPAVCPCIKRFRNRNMIYLKELYRKWVEKDYEIIYRDEFNTQTFTINFHTFLLFKSFFKDKNGYSDFSVLSVDCFHLSQRGHAISANALWNNMLEDPDKKSLWRSVIMEKFICPTEERPYIITRENFRMNFKT